MMLVSACVYKSAPLSSSPTVVDVTTLTGNVLDGRASHFDPELDYFPDKISFHHARQLRIDYRGHYKLITFTPNVQGDALMYVLVQRGTPIPDLPEIRDPLTKVVQVPVERVSLGSMRYGGAADLIGVVDRLSMVSALRSITTPSIQSRIETGETLEAYAIEMQIDREVEVVMDYYSNSGESLGAGKTRELKLVNIPMAEHLEETPLAKSEWVKFFASFFNREKIVNEKFDEIERSYNETRAQVQEKLARVQDRPKVLVNYKDGDKWPVYGGLNAFAQLIADAGGEYLWKDLPYRNSIYEIPYEAAYDLGAEADVWIVGPDFSFAYGDGKARFDERLKRLKASEKFYVSNNPTAQKRNPWWDQALISPHIELMDYVRAIHPDLLPEHEFRFLRRIQ